MPWYTLVSSAGQNGLPGFVANKWKVSIEFILVPSLCRTNNCSKILVFTFSLISDENLHNDSRKLLPYLQLYHFLRVELVWDKLVYLTPTSIELSATYSIFVVNNIIHIVYRNCQSSTKNTKYLFLIARVFNSQATKKMHETLPRPKQMFTCWS